MKHYIKDDIYYIVDDQDNVLLSIKLTDEPGNQIIIETEKDKYAGPVDLIFD